MAQYVNNRLPREQCERIDRAVSHALNRLRFNTPPHVIEAQYQKTKATPQRLRFDLLAIARVRLCSSTMIPEPENQHPEAVWITVYDHGTDEHVDTVLRRVLRRHGMKWAAMTDKQYVRWQYEQDALTV